MYADGVCDREFVLTFGYYLARFSQERVRGYVPGAMYATGLSWEEGLGRCPSNVYLACNNSTNGITIAGEKVSTTEFVEQLAAEGVFVKQILSNDWAYHCPYADCVAQAIGDLKNKVHVWCPFPTYTLCGEGRLFSDYFI